MITFLLKGNFFPKSSHSGDNPNSDFALTLYYEMFSDLHSVHEFGDWNPLFIFEHLEYVVRSFSIFNPVLNLE